MKIEYSTGLTNPSFPANFILAIKLSKAHFFIKNRARLWNINIKFLHLIKHLPEKTVIVAHSCTAIRITLPI